MKQGNNGNRKRNKQENEKQNESGQGKQNCTSDHPFKQLLTGKKIELVTAALLIQGKLTVDQVALDRKGGVTVALVGQFQKQESKNTTDLLNFFDSHGNMTMDEVFDALKKKIT